jgi:hypothetical protein
LGGRPQISTNRQPAPLRKTPRPGFGPSRRSRIWSDDPQTIIVIEQGRRSPGLKAAFKIARVFGAPLEEVFQYEE